MGYGDSALDRTPLLDLTVNLPGTASDNLETFTYNPARQIASRAQTNDLYAFPVAASFDRSYTANGRNQYTAAGPATFAYDANGNLSQSTAPNASSVSVTTTYHYDVENRMVGLDDGTTNAMLRYDPLGRLYEMWTSAGGTRRFLHDGTDLVAEYDAGGTMTQRYVHGPSSGDDPVIWYPGSSMASSNARYLMADERGSIVAVTDASGAAVAINTYDEYGIPDNATTGAISTSGRFRYTGQAWLPEIGLYYYKARMYSPTLGRFMQTDPIGYADGMNWYNYVGGDPVNKVDPMGLDGIVVNGNVIRDKSEIQRFFDDIGNQPDFELLVEGIRDAEVTTPLGPQSGLLQGICHLAEGIVEPVSDFGVDVGLVVAVGGVAVTGGDPAGAIPGLGIAGVSGDVSAGSQLVADLTQARGLGDVAKAGGRAAINALGGRVVTRALRGIRIGPYLDKAGQTGLNGAIGEAASKAAGVINWLDPHYGC